MVTVRFEFPKKIISNATVRRAVESSALFIRDLWLARSPYATGAYAKGLMMAGSIKIGDGYMEVRNLSKHAQTVESGFKAYNLGMAILRGGKGVKTAKDGSRYKIIKIEDGPTSRFRKTSVAEKAGRSFQKIIPYGIKSSTLTKYGQIRSYQAKRALQRPLKGGKPNTTGPRGIFIISEKAIQKNPNKWMMPQREGRKLGLQIQREASPLIKQAIIGAIKMESERQIRAKGVGPKWYKPSMARNPLKTIPVRRGR